MLCCSLFSIIAACETGRPDWRKALMDRSRVGGAARASGFGWRFCVPLFVGAALNPINSSLIATAIVPIAAAVGVSVGRCAALVSALYLASAIAQPTAGKLCEVFGARRVFLTGIGALIAGGLIGGLGGSLTVLTLARVFIGVGTSSAYPAAMLLVRGRAEQEGMDGPPGAVLGGLVITGTVTAAAGLPLGGVLIDAWGWRTTFLVNVPVGVVAAAITLVWIPPDKKALVRRTFRQVVSDIDVVGVVGFGGTLGALMVFLVSLPQPRWGVLGAAVVMGSSLLWWELRARSPFIDVRMLTRHPGLRLTYLRFALTTLCMYAVLYGVTQWLQVGRGFSAMSTGMLLLPMTGLAALIAQPVAARSAVRIPLMVSAGSCLIGSIAVLWLNAGTGVGWILVVTVIFGVTLGTTSSANQTALYTQVPADRIATASGLLRSCGYIGSIASAAVISLAFHTAVDDHGLHLIGWTLVGVSIIGVVALAGDRAVVPNFRRIYGGRTATIEAQK